MKVILVSTLFTTLVTFANGMNINLSNINLSGINSQVLSLKNPNVRATTSVTYGNFDDDINSKLNPSLAGLSEEEKACTLEIQKYNSCANPSELSEKVCKELLEGKCKEFYKDPMSKIPSCKNIDKNELELVIHMYKYMGYMVQLGCIDDGNCPVMLDIVKYTDYNRANSIAGTKKKGYFPDESVLKENCKSAECSDKAVHVFEELIGINESSAKYVEEAINSKEFEGMSREAFEQSLKNVEEQNTVLKSSIETLKNCKSTSAGYLISKTLSNLCIDSLLITIFFFLYMRN